MAAIGQLFVELGVNVAAFVDGMDKATYKAKQTSKEIAAAFKDVGKDIAGSFSEISSALGGQFGEVGAAIGKLTEAMGGISKAGGGAAAGILGLGAVAVATAAGLTEMAVKGAELIHTLDMTSQKTGISIRDLQTLQAAGSTVGLSVEGMTMGFRRFDQAIAGVGRGSGAAQVVLRNLGITAKDNNEALNQAADAFSKMEDGPRKAADAIALFGRAGLNLIPLLNKGRQGLLEFKQMVDQYGPSIGNDAKKANEDFLVSQAKLNLAWQSATVELANDFLPTINKVITAMAGLTKGTVDYFKSLQTESWGDIATFWKNVFTGQAAGKGLGKNIAQPNSGNDAAMKERSKKAHDQEIAALQKELELAKAGGDAQYKLQQTKEKIADLSAMDSAEDVKSAIALQKQLPALEAAAKIEKARTEELAKRADYVKPEQDAVDDMVNKLATQKKAQDDVLEALKDSTGAQLIAKATAQATQEIESKRLELVKQLQAETRKLQGLKETPGQIASSPEIQQLQAELNKLKQIAPEFVATKQQMAVGGTVSAGVASNTKAADNAEEQAAAMHKLAQAYTEGGAAIQNAQIDQKLLSQTKAIDDEEKKLKALGDVQGTSSKAYKEQAAAIDIMRAARERARVAAQAEAQDKIVEKLGQEKVSAQAATAAWILNTAAITQNKAAQIAAAGAAAGAKFKVENPTATDSQAQEVAARAVQAEQQKYDAEVQTLAAQNLLNLAYDDEIKKLTAAREIIQEKGQSTLAIDAAIYDKQQENIKQWDEAADKVGNFDERMKSMLNQIQIEGQDIWKSFEQAGLQALGQINDAIVKMTLTGKANFKEIGKNLAGSLESAALKKGEAAGAQFLGDKIPALKGLLPGDKGKPKGNKTDPIYTVSVAAGAIPGAGPASGGSTSVIGSLFGGGVGAALGPLGSKTNPMYTMDAGGGLDSGGDSSDSSDSGMGGMAGGLIGTILKMATMFSGGMAEGGDVTPGNAYIVGEKHPEFFVPGKSGQIVPTLKTGGTTVQQHTTHVHFHGVQDMDTFKKNQSQIMNGVGNAVGRAMGRK